MEAVHIYQLRQTSRSIQTLVVLRESAASDVLEIKVHAGPGLLIRKPDMVISRNQNGVLFQIAGVKFEKHGGGFSINHLDLNLTQHLSRENPESQSYIMNLNGRSHAWRPIESKSSLDLTDGKDGRLIARFTYSDSVNYSNSTVIKNGGTLGELLVIKSRSYEPAELEQILCSAIAMVEKRKRLAQK